MKLGLFQSFNPWESLESDYPPLGLGYLASYLQKNLDFYDICFAKHPDDLAGYHPDLIGVSAVTQYYTYAVKKAKELREKTDARFVIGGSHITSVPESLDPVFDCGVIGEGEQTFLELVRLFENNQWGAEHWKEVDGIVFRNESGEVVRTEPRAQLDPMDTIPPPDRDLLGDQWNLPFNRFMSLITSRGCPYDCAFCASQLHYKGVRYFSAEYVVRELEAVMEKWHPAAISFWDDLFIGDAKRLREPAHLIREKGLHEKAVFRCSTRANLITEERLELLKSFNVQGINFGAESGSDQILAYLKGGNVSVEQNQRALDLCQEYGLRVGCSFVIGAPPETKEDLTKTLGFVRRNRDKLEEAQFYPVIPFPGTRLWEWAREHGRVPDPVNWDAFSMTIEGDAWWRDYYFLNEHMSVEEFRLLYYQLKEESLKIALRETHRKITRLEEALHEQWETNAAHRRFRSRRAVRWVEKVLKLKDAFK